MTQTPTSAEQALATATDEASLARSVARSAEIEADLDVNPGHYRMLTGVRPTGNMHLGHYFGTMRSWAPIQDRGVDTWILVADYQVITDRDGVGPIRERVLSLVADALAVGVDPQRSTIFAHSAVPEQNQLMLPFLSLVTEAELHRNPTVKAELEATDGRAMSGLMLTYPVHQAADILFCQANLVPVGKDQLPHLEQARLIAQRFDKRYGRAVKEHPVFRRPEALLGEAPLLLGLDGEKMSKSRHNTIELRMSADETAKALKKAKTDSDRNITYDPVGRPEVSNLLTLASLCGAGAPEEIAERIGDGGAGTLKKVTTEAVNEFFAPIRARRAELVADEGYLLQVLHGGNERARKVATQTLEAVRTAMHMNYEDGTMTADNVDVPDVPPDATASAPPVALRHLPRPVDVVSATPQDRTAPWLRLLLWHAAECEDGVLDRIVAEELPRLTMLKAVAGGEPVGFVAHTGGGPRAGGGAVMIEYIASSPALRGAGVGTALVGEVRRRHPGAVLLARTDDDAVGFYRALGFVVRPASEDPRWPGRARYECMLDG